VVSVVVTVCEPVIGLCECLVCEVRVVLLPRRRCIREGLAAVLTVSPRVVVAVCIFGWVCGDVVLVAFGSCESCCL